MILAFLGHEATEDKLADLLGTQYFGTPAPHLARLSQLGFHVLYESTTLETIQHYLASDTPCLVFV